MSGEGDRVSRPNSLLLETPPPEREPLRFDVQLVGAPPEVEQLVNNIKQVAEDFLYHWKTFPIVLPKSQFSGPGNRLCDIIIAPPCEELDGSVLDISEQHPLTPKQLHSIRERGEFEVPSRHFPGQTHIWRVAPWLQRGRQRAREDLYCQLGNATSLVVVVARDRLLTDKPFSTRAGGKALLKGLHRLLDLIFGLPSMEARDLEKKLREERSRYLVAELICKPEHQEDIAALASWVMRALRRATSEKADLRDANRTQPRVPCVYTTPQRTQVDLRLYRRELIRRSMPHLAGILERESRGWFLHFREKRAALLQNQKMPYNVIEEEVRVSAMREYVTRVSNAVKASETLRSLGEGLPELFAEQLQASALLNRAEEGVRSKLEEGLAAAEAKIRITHPILSRSDAWRKEKLAIAEEKIKSELRWTALEDAANAMQAHKLQQHRYFLLRDLAFLKDREPLLMKELRAAKTPTREFKWSTRIWLPQRWVIVRHLRGRSDRVPAVLIPRPCSAGGRPDPAHPTHPAHPTQHSQPVFSVCQDTHRHTATRWPFWRIINWAHRTWCWSWNMMFLLGVVVPWSSPVSVRTLLSTKPVVSDYELSQVNGTLFPKRSSETHTMWSRLLKLWRHVSKERTRFETEPDAGFLGKGLSRQANRLWNYGVVGGLGSLALLLLFPIVVVIACTLSLAAAITVPIWMPAVTILVHVSNALFYDIDCPNPNKLNRFFVLFEVLIWQIGVFGILQPILAFLLAVIILPLCAFIWLVGGIFWWCIRSAWEEFIWRAVVKRRAIVPGRDGAAVRRAKDKPQATITAAQALAAVCARGELEVLSMWEREMEVAIERPLRDYEHFIDACFGPFSVQIAKKGSYKQLEKECSELIMSLREKVTARKTDLAFSLSDSVRARIRMSTDDLKRAVQASAVELSRLYGTSAANDEWWTERGLQPNDWHSLAANTLVEVFSADIAHGVCAELGLASLERGAGEARWRRGGGPPDVASGATDEWWCGVSRSRAPPPALEVSVFSPRAPHHPPLPAPILVALVLHNRDSDNPVPMDSDLCAEILRTLEDAPDCDDKRDYVGRYRGGGSEDASSDNGSYNADDDDSRSRDTHDTRNTHDTRDTSDNDPDEHVCRVSPQASRAACRWTLTGRGVRLRADLASPEDVTLDIDRSHQGTSV